MVDFSNVHKSDNVEISLLTNPNRQSSGKVIRVLSSNSSETIVVLENGDKGKVVQIINSIDTIKERIMTESQYTENKENFGTLHMCDKVIPQTVQSFLNSEGGYLYIGIKDTGNLDERLVGLDVDFELISGSETMTNDKLCDKLSIKITDYLKKYITSCVPIGPLVELNFVHINNIQILEITIKKSPNPWFYQHLTKHNKPKQFELIFQNESFGKRCLDDFYIRSGAGKKPLQTSKEISDYLYQHFINK